MSPVRDCFDCGRRWEPRGPAALYTNICQQCREAAVAPTIALLSSIQSMNPLEAYVRGILSEKVKAHDHDAIRELGVILDRMRVPA